MISDKSWTIILENMALCNVIAQKFKPLPSYITIEDLITGPGLTCMIRCVRNWDASKGRFSTYAYTSIYRSMSRYIMQIYSKRSTEVEILETEPDIDVREKNESKIDAYNILSSVPKFDRTILLMRYWQCKTYDEIASFLECSKTQAFIYLQEAIERCRDTN